MEITTIGLDIAKRVFQVHGADATGKGQLRRKLQRADVLTFFASLPPCLVGIEACSTAHYWAREIRALGHEVRLMPASCVKPYVKRGKTDAADAEAICEAVTRPTMRFVPIKSAEQQAVLMLHRTRDLLVRQRTMLVNALRGHMAELACHHSWRRTDYRLGNRGDGHRSRAIPIGAAVRRLDWAGTKAEQQWRQGTPKRHIQTGRSLSAPLACAGCDCSDPTCTYESHRRDSMAPRRA
jgi:transposase